MQILTLASSESKRSLRRKVAETLLAAVTEPVMAREINLPATVDGTASRMLSAPSSIASSEQATMSASSRADRPTKADGLYPGNIPP